VLPAPTAPRRRDIPWTQTASWALPSLVLSVATANPELTALAVASLALLVLMLWRPGEPPVLLFACGFQWLQASLKVLYADVLGEAVWRLPDTPHGIEEASAWSMAWCVAIGVGIAIVLRLRRRQLESARSAPAPERFGDLLRLYFVWTLLLFVVEPFVPGGLWQVLVGLGNLRWAVFFAILAHALRTREHVGLVTGIFFVELAFGFLSFFSAFRTPVFVLALALSEGRMRLRGQHYLGGVAVAALAVLLAVGWTAIKVEYRAAISGGSNTQVVSVGVVEQAGILFDLVTGIDAEALGDGADQLIDRIAYVDFFAQTMTFVPRIRRHEDGRLWLAAVNHVLMPRAFFPDKAPLEPDTTRAERYTGLWLSQAGGGTSIALGAPAESYVDFGVPGMLMPALLFGIFAGFTYAWSIAGSSALIDRGIAVALILLMSSVENSPAKMLGGLLSTFVIALLVRPVLRRWLAREAPASSPVPAA